MPRPIDRRTALTLTAGTALIAAVPAPALALTSTPRQAEGPFYPRARDLTPDTDNDLVKIEGAVREAGGTVLHLSGRVLDGDGAPLPGAIVEIWQCDVNGRYLHGRDRSTSRPRDPAFQGFGRTITAEDGSYRFRTIKPVVYPGRTPHIHVKVIHSTAGSLTTQMYVTGDPLNARDGLYRRLSPEAQEAVTIALGPSANHAGDLDGVFDIVLG